MFADYHVHSYFSEDTDFPMELEIQKAIELGMDELCFTEHSDYDVPTVVNCDYDAYFKEMGYKIDYQSINEISSRLSGNTKVIDSELEKLYLYKLNDKVINLEDVKNVITKYEDNNVFKLVDAVIKKDKRKIFNLYKESLNNKEEPVVILTMLANQFRLMYECKVLYEKNMSFKDIASLLKEHPYRVQLSVGNSNNVSKKELKRIILKLAETDYQIKTGITEGSKALEAFFIEL